MNKWAHFRIAVGSKQGNMKVYALRHAGKKGTGKFVEKNFAVAPGLASIEC